MRTGWKDVLGFIVSVLYYVCILRHLPSRMVSSCFCVVLCTSSVRYFCYHRSSISCTPLACCFKPLNDCAIHTSLFHIDPTRVAMYVTAVQHR
ncbi:hypothetical protein C8Q78DRAFT_20624 [Trametes maxima]|nr:hypothetical protein C8Q78DRAFT_20624 [Trametes maxima]